jgi:protein-tyrosine phosphatase
VGLIDLHCHILPAIDDGASDLADALAMARQAQADGITVVCATPHIRRDHDVDIAELRERVSELEGAFAARGLPLAVAQGGEVSAADLDDLDAAELRLVSLGATGRWILLEPASGPLDHSLRDAVDRLAAHGLRAVIAHPERHLGPDFHEHLADLVGNGALVQVTAAHVLSDVAGPALVDLAARGLAHVVASDAHSAHWGRPVAVRAAIDRLEREAGAEVAAFARDAPAAILRGEDPVPTQPATTPTGS